MKKFFLPILLISFWMVSCTSLEEELIVKTPKVQVTKKTGNKPPVEETGEEDQLEDKD